MLKISNEFRQKPRIHAAKVPVLILLMTRISGIIK